MMQTGLSIGTPQYLSPAQAMGERTIDVRSDVYALGAVTHGAHWQPAVHGHERAGDRGEGPSRTPDGAPSIVRDTVPASERHARDQGRVCGSPSRASRRTYSAASACVAHQTVFASFAWMCAISSSSATMRDRCPLT